MRKSFQFVDERLKQGGNGESGEKGFNSMKEESTGPMNRLYVLNR